MIEVVLLQTGGVLAGYHITGHSGFAQQGFDIVCSAVSSAAYMAANTITEVKQADAGITVDDGLMYVKLSLQDAAACADILQGFKLHIQALAEQYPKYITVKNSEV